MGVTFLNKSISDFEEKIKNKRVAVIGLGVSNTPLIKFLFNKGAYITAFDKKQKSQIANFDELAEFVYQFSLGDNYLENLVDFDYIFRTPGMRYDLPNFLEEKEKGAIIISETELFLELCPCKVIGVTGSDGKTTTSTIIYKMLKSAGFDAFLGGNIGVPLIEYIEEINENNIVVLELSSFQLHTFTKSPQISIITNISPNHLDYHKSYDEYIDSKKNIFKFQDNKGKLIINYDNAITREFANDSKGEVIFFSRVNSIENGIFLKNDNIIFKKNNVEIKMLDSSDIKIPGVHNIENYMAAISAVYDIVETNHIKDVATNFGGVEHRIEFVRTLNGISFYNDSIGSSPTRTIASINSFGQKVILIAGGYDKNIPFDDLGSFINERVKKVFLIGKTADKIEESIKVINKDYEVIRCSCLEESILEAYKSAICGDIILLSPACASFDMYKDFAERGNVFKFNVNNL